jgi:hypothetical protein
MHSHYLFLALDLARERAAEADAVRLASLGRRSDSIAARIRRRVARLAVAVAFAVDDEVGSVALTTH